MSLSVDEKSILGHLEMVCDDDKDEMLDVLDELRHHVETRGPEVAQ